MCRSGKSGPSADPGPMPMARILHRFDPTLTPVLGVVLGFGLGSALDWDRTDAESDGEYT